MHLVKIQYRDDGDKVDLKDQRWCLVRVQAGSEATVCTGEVFGLGEGSAVYKEKFKGKITCEDCIGIVKWFKRIKL